MRAEARAAAYSLAERVWTTEQPTSVEVKASTLMDLPEVAIHPAGGDRDGRRVEALMGRLGVPVTARGSGSLAAWVEGVVSWEGHDVTVAVFHDLEDQDPPPRRQAAQSVTIIGDEPEAGR